MNTLKVVSKSFEMPSELILSSDDYANRRNLSICMTCLRIHSESFKKCLCDGGVSIPISQLEDAGIDVMEEVR